MAWGLFKPKSPPTSSHSQPMRSVNPNIPSGAYISETKLVVESRGVSKSKRSAVSPQPPQAAVGVSGNCRQSLAFTAEGSGVTTTKTAPKLASSKTPADGKIGSRSSSHQSSSSKRYSSSHSVRSVRSMRSIGSIGQSSSRSLRSSNVSIRTRHVKAAHAAKRAAATFFSNTRDHNMKCYTCGSDLYSIRCDTCRTTYIPPDFRYNAVSAALYANNNASMGHNGIDNMFGGLMAIPGGSTSSNSVGEGSQKGWRKSRCTPSLNGSTTNPPSSTGSTDAACSISGAESLIGFVPENEIDHELETKKLDLELVEDLARFDEAGLLEELLFECFSNVNAVVNTFCRASQNDEISTGSIIPAEYFVNNNSEDNERAITPTDSQFQDLIGNSGMAAGVIEENVTGNESPTVRDTSESCPIDSKAVQKMYSTLASVSSTSPMRGILQGAQAVLQVRQHAPLTERELIYISIVLQCPAITDCSMFTKITGPMQKLSRYVGLRARGRTIFEVCAGLVANADESLHNTLSTIFASLDLSVFSHMVDLCNAYISHRLSFDFTAKTNSGRPSKFQLIRHDWYSEDWHVITVVKLLTLFYVANGLSMKNDASTSASFSGVVASGESRSTLLPDYAFYNTMIDFVDLRADYDNWQLTKAFKKPKFSFCRYPFILSVGAKSKVFEHSIQREINASIQRECFSMMALQDPNSRQVTPVPSLYVHMRISRQNLLDDSIKLIQKWHLTPKQRLLKIEFKGEPGIDAGGLTKEWFYLFYQRIFEPSLNVFVADDSSNYCWFGSNPDPAYYRVAGMVLGFALFNGITVDINFPLLLYKLLLNVDYDLNDVGTLWPEISQSLQRLLDYEEDDCEEAFGLTFTAPDGTPLIMNGHNTDVNLANRDVYVKLLLEHLVNAEGMPFQAFKAGFDDVCSGNTLLLFQPEELELLIRGDRKPIDILSLRSVTRYVNFGHRYAKANNEPVVQWFWDYFQNLDPQSQARLLQFITSTDRAPASGMVHMKFSIKCLGPDSERLPIAHTCFNELCIYKYKTRKKLESKLSLAISEYQGFGLK